MQFWVSFRFDPIVDSNPVFPSLREATPPLGQLGG